MTNAYTAPFPQPGQPRRRTVSEVMHTNPKLCDPAATVNDLRRLFADEHVHAALIVENAVLLTVVDRSDLAETGPGPADGAQRGARPALVLGTLAGRVVRDTADLATAHRITTATGRRRLAVIDADGRCLGLLCLKHHGTGFCSDADVAHRRQDHDQSQSYASPQDTDGESMPTRWARMADRSAKVPS